MNKYVVIISVDAMSNTEFDIIKNLPTFKSFISEGSYAKRVTSVYPSLTYTCHTSILTGTYPNKHGIFSNYQFQPFKPKPDWFWYAKDIKVKTLVDYVSEKGGTVGSVFWPVMAGNKKIDWNCPEVWSNDPKVNQILLSLNAGSKCFQLKMAIANIKNLSGIIKQRQPNLDKFITNTSIHMIKKYRPNLSLIHLIAHDHEKHVLGATGPHIKQILMDTDKRISKIIEATKKAGFYDDCTFVILGDHSNLSYDNIIYLNAILHKNGFIELNQDGSIKNWKAYALSCDGSAQIFLNHIKYKNDIYTLLKELKEKEDGIEEVYTKEELERLFHTGGPFEFMLEAKRGYCFGKSREFNCIYDSVKDIQSRGDKIYQGHHGYSPFKPEYQTMLFMKGVNIKKGSVIQDMNLTDIAPTISRLFGFDMVEIDGQRINGFFE